MVSILVASVSLMSNCFNC
uniref:Uncharacterized protein n=1 Tax=Anguilla anguilla TaxID=7936 RepID=A0A0E9VWP1_ANGAN